VTGAPSTWNSTDCALRVDHAIGTADVVPEQVTSGITEKLVTTVSVLVAGAAVGEAVTVTVPGEVDAGVVPVGAAGAQPATRKAPAAIRTATDRAADRTPPMAPLPDRAGDPGEMISQPAR
jgi:antitoxin (DNA-binding transcriptional repressor) of toxin-antitoxin stability system